MTAISPCVNWADESDLPESCDLTGVFPDTLANAFTFASTVLFNLTNRRWLGECTDEYRPFSYNCCWLAACGESTVYHSAIKLPAPDVRSITAIKIDGEVISPSEYMLRGRYVIARRQADGTVRSWPCWQDLHRADDTETDTFSIAYVHGANPPSSMVQACALLAWEFALAWSPACEGNCRLPQRVTTMTRGGTSFAILDPLTVFDQGRTGVPDIDMLIAAVNRGESRKRAFVGRPGMPTQVYR